METARDLSIIILAVFAIIQALAITALAVALFLLVRTLQRKVMPVLDRVPPLIDQVPPILETAQRSVQAVERAAHRVEVAAAISSEKVVKPIITIASFFAGARATVQALAAVITGGQSDGQEASQRRTEGEEKGPPVP
ncbi:MAG: hypothetical protein KatS3mg061_1118 [Dehalococcoidia bacterium]|nr:MAG: hypothetical protein KatS3mg061_1118 [Dehalococcoidia bacterium]